MNIIAQRVVWKMFSSCYMEGMVIRSFRRRLLSSDYFKKTVEVLSDNHLLALFENRQVKVKVVLHPFMKKFEQYFTKMQTTATNIKFYSFDEISIGNEMKEADMLLN